MSQWSIYLIRTRDQALYTGIATDVMRRLAEHRNGRGSKYLRSRGPLQLVFHLPVGDRSLALRVEARLKRLDKDGKEQIAMTLPDRERLLAILDLVEDDQRQC